MKLFNFYIVIVTLLILSACDVISSSNQNIAEENSSKKERNNSSEPEENHEDYIGVCSMDLIDMVSEDKIISVIIDLKMESYVSEKELSEKEVIEQREAVAELQHEFLNSLSNYNISGASTHYRKPWLTLDVDEEALIFMCAHEMAKSINQNAVYTIQ